MKKNNKEKKYKTALLSGGKSTDYNTPEYMNEQIKQLGGMLTFIINKQKDGWYAECEQLNSIITGGKQKNPTDSEIEENIRETIRTAFHITKKNLKNNVKTRTETKMSVTV